MNILQQRVCDVLLGKKDEFLWILEHKSVYTAGTSSIDADLIDKSIDVIRTNRGGKHTYHGPGQKVVYFVLNLNKRKRDIRKLVNKIENCIIDILNEYKIKSYPDKQNIFLQRLRICVFTFISPVYCIIQEPFLIVNRYISILTFLIVTLLAIIGIFIERWLFVKESQQNIYDNNA